jgi:hypothetical protein
VLPAAFWIWAFAIEPASLRTREYERRVLAFLARTLSDMPMPSARE